MPTISTRGKLFAILPVAALAAGAALIAATDTANAFPRGGGMRPMMVRPMMARPQVHPTNVEMTVKVLNGRTMHRRYGPMTDVGYTVTVTDTQTGRVHRPLIRSHNGNARQDPFVTELVKSGKFRVIEREQL